MPATPADPLSLWPRRGLEWLVRDDRLLADGVAAGLDLFDLAAALEREPVEVAVRGAQRLGAGDDLSFELWSEEVVTLLDLALSGVPLAPALSWCRAAADRPAAGELEDLRKVPSCFQALEFAAEHGIWDVRYDTLDALEQLMSRPAHAVRAAVAALHVGFEAVTTATLAAALGGRAPTPAKLAPTPAGAAFPPRQGGGSSGRRFGKGSGATRGRSSRTGGRRRGRSPSYPAPGAAQVDRRTPAERAWKSRTHW